MPNYYITFGQKYRHEPHPTGLPIHPDACTKVIASDITAARNIAFDCYGPYWGFIYEESEFDAKDFPRGCTETINKP